MEKAELRRNLLKKRQSIPVEEWRKKSSSICNHLLTSPLFTQAKTILAYFSFRQEPDLSYLLINGDSTHTTNQTTKIWGFPRCVDNTLLWHTWTPDKSVKTGAYGIPEPDANASIIKPEQVDLILVPSVACDYQGYRLGYGGGYYDRLFSLPEWATKSTIGILFDFAYLPQVPIEDWDKPLQSVCTESGFNYFH